MKSVWLKSLLAIVGFLAFVGIAVPSFELAMTSFWKPRFQAVERDVFENTSSYKRGKITQLNKLRGEYETADESQKTGLAAVIRREASQIDRSLLPVDLKIFIEEL
jgi:hypothetical protein